MLHGEPSNTPQLEKVKSIKMMSKKKGLIDISYRLADAIVKLYEPLFLWHHLEEFHIDGAAAQGALGLGLGLGTAHEAGVPHEKVGGINGAVAVNIMLLVR